MWTSWQLLDTSTSSGYGLGLRVLPMFQDLLLLLQERILEQDYQVRVSGGPGKATGHVF